MLRAALPDQQKTRIPKPVQEQSGRADNDQSAGNQLFVLD